MLATGGGEPSRSGEVKLWEVGKGMLGRSLQSLHSDTVFGADGIDALEGLTLTALTQSPRFVQVGSETVGADRCESFERR